MPLDIFFILFLPKFKCVNVLSGREVIYILITGKKRIYKSNYYPSALQCTALSFLAAQAWQCSVVSASFSQRNLDNIAFLKKTE